MMVNAVIKHTHLTDWFLHTKLKEFVDFWLHKTLDAEWYWFRYKYQAFGSTHAHGCAKVKNDPGLCELVKIAALGWMEEKAKIMTLTTINTLLYMHSRQKKKKKKRAIAYYADWLMTTINPEGHWTLPQPYPSLSWSQISSQH